MQPFSSNEQVLLDQIDAFVSSGDGLAPVRPPSSMAATSDQRLARLAGSRPVQPNCLDLSAVPEPDWTELCRRAVEPNAFYDPSWCRALWGRARDSDGVTALLAWGQSRNLIGLLPVRRARPLNLPLPLLVSWTPYAPLTVPLLDKDAAEEAAGQLIDAAAAVSPCALLMPHMSSGGSAFAAIEAALDRRNMPFQILRRYERATLDARQDVDALLSAALGGKKLKELRRQRKRLADMGAVEVEIASTPQSVAHALEEFLHLEAKGWKGRRGTALLQDPGDAAFIRLAAPALAAQGRFEIVMLKRAGALLAGGLVLRQADRAFFFKISFEEAEARTSPGVQLTLDLTRRLCDDVRINSADSTADADHPMINHIWRGRMAMADIFIPLRGSEPVASLIRNLIVARYAAHDCARPVVHFLRKVKDQLT